MAFNEHAQFTSPLNHCQVTSDDCGVHSGRITHLQSTLWRHTPWPGVESSDVTFPWSFESPLRDSVIVNQLAAMTGGYLSPNSIGRLASHQTCLGHHDNLNGCPHFRYISRMDGARVEGTHRTYTIITYITANHLSCLVWSVNVQGPMGFPDNLETSFRCLIFWCSLSGYIQCLFLIFR